MSVGETIMLERYRMYRRNSGCYYAKDKVTGKSDKGLHLFLSIEVLDISLRVTRRRRFDENSAWRAFGISIFRGDGFILNFANHFAESRIGRTNLRGKRLAKHVRKVSRHQPAKKQSMHQPIDLTSLKEIAKAHGGFCSLSAVFAHATITCKDGREEKVAVGNWAPLIFISEYESEFLVEVELAAIQPEGLRVLVKTGILIVSGNLDLAQRSGIEGDYGHFARSMLLPENVDVGKANVEVESGLLKVHLPKQQSKSIVIDI